MCVIVVAHRASKSFPLVVAANRDEEYARPARPLAFWDEVPDIAAGRDERQGGAWLAVSRNGRFAAVTNIRGAAKPEAPSRGLLVSSFLRSSDAPAEFLRRIAKNARDYAGFHLICGVIGGEFAYFSNAADEIGVWDPGIYGISNAPPGEEWVKSADSAAMVSRCLEEAESERDLVSGLLTFLETPGEAARQRGVTRLEEIESEVFVMSDRYGTRASTVVVATEREVLMVEQRYGPMGVAEGGPTELRFAISRAASSEA